MVPEREGAGNEVEKPRSRDVCRLISVGARSRSPSPPPWLDKDRPMPVPTKLRRIQVHCLGIHLVTVIAAPALEPKSLSLDLYSYVAGGSGAFQT